MKTFKCSTLFDITATGVTGHFKAARVPFSDATGKLIEDDVDWNYARNQQRNWETLTQIISLRCHIQDITQPISINKMWSFEFTSETPGAYGSEENPTFLLEQDCEGIPMIVDLNNTEGVANRLLVGKNIWFSVK
jgi:hypothetical protein